MEGGTRANVAIRHCNASALCQRVEGEEGGRSLWEGVALMSGAGGAAGKQKAD